MRDMLDKIRRLESAVFSSEEMCAVVEDRLPVAKVAVLWLVERGSTSMMLHQM